MHIVEIESANKINFRNLIAAEETIKRLNRFIIELRTNQDTSDPGVPYFMRAVLSLTEDVVCSIIMNNKLYFFYKFTKHINHVTYKMFVIICD